MSDSLLLAFLTVVSVLGSPPTIFWLSQDVGPGETLMVVGWDFSNQSSVLVDGKALKVVGRSENALMATLPASSRSDHQPNISVVDAGQQSNELTLNQAEIWWAVGDEGPAATAGGWIRCFGRALRLETVAGSTPPSSLRAGLAHLSASQNWDPEALQSLLEEHKLWLAQAALKEKADDVGTGTVLQLVAGSANPVFIQADPGTLTGNSATFAVPVDIRTGLDYELSVSTTGVTGPFVAMDTFIDPERPNVRSLLVLHSTTPITALRNRVNISDFGPTGLNHSTGSPTDPNKWSSHPINATGALVSRLQV
jgi:hypothetical protein